MDTHNQDQPRESEHDPETHERINRLLTGEVRVIDRAFAGLLLLVVGLMVLVNMSASQWLADFVGETRQIVAASERHEDSSESIMILKLVLGVLSFVLACSIQYLLAACFVPPITRKWFAKNAHMVVLSMPLDNKKVRDQSLAAMGICLLAIIVTSVMWLHSS